MPLDLRIKITMGMVLALLVPGFYYRRQQKLRLAAEQRLLAETQEREHVEQAVLESARLASEVAEINARLRSCNTLEEFAQQFLSNMATKIGICHGLFYLADEQVQSLVVVGGYAAPAGVMGRKFGFGEGLAGQCAREKVVIRISPVPAGYLPVTSGTGSAPPSCVELRPLMLDGVLQGVVEFAGFSPADDRGEKFLSEIETVAAGCIDLIRRRHKYQEQFMMQLEFQQALIDSIPNPIFYKDTDTRFLGCNTAYEQAFNVQKADFVGKRVLDLEYLDSNERLAYQREDEQIIAEMGSVKREVLLTFADGTTRNCLYWVRGFSLSDGAAGGLVGTFIPVEG